MGALKPYSVGLGLGGSALAPGLGGSAFENRSQGHFPLSHSTGNMRGDGVDIPLKGGDSSSSSKKKTPASVDFGGVRSAALLNAVGVVVIPEASWLPSLRLTAQSLLALIGGSRASTSDDASGMLAWLPSVTQADARRCSVDVSGSLPGAYQLYGDGLYDGDEPVVDSRPDLPNYANLVAQLVRQAEPLAQIAYETFFGETGRFDPVGSTAVQDEMLEETGTSRLRRLACNVMFVRTSKGAVAQDWHRDQAPFLKRRPNDGSLSADVHFGIRISGTFNEDGGIEYQPGNFGVDPSKDYELYTPDASQDDVLVAHMGDVLHHGTASAQARMALYIGFTPCGIYVEHGA